MNRVGTIFKVPVEVFAISTKATWDDATGFFVQALRILDNACDSCLEDPKNFNLWRSLEK